MLTSGPAGPQCPDPPWALPVLLQFLAPLCGVKGHHSGCGPMGEVTVEEKLMLGLLCFPKGQSLLSSRPSQERSKWGRWKHSNQGGLIPAQPDLLDSWAHSAPLTDSLMGEQEGEGVFVEGGTGSGWILKRNGREA